MNKMLIIRFSSFGDIIQTTGILPGIKKTYPHLKIDFLTRNEFKQLLEVNPHINQTISFHKKDGLWGLLKLALHLARKDYDIIFDAHNNLRSLILRIIFFFFGKNVIVRSKFRIKRFFLFNMKRNLFHEPFMGIRSYAYPLRDVVLGIEKASVVSAWRFSEEVIKPVNELIKFDKYIALAPSAAWELKRWPIDHWKSLILSIPETNFVILGGPEDKFCQELEDLDPQRVQNIAGKTSLLESCYVASRAQALISGDTGLLHVADVLGVHGIALIGPTACYPTNPHMLTLETELSCKPCSKDGRGKCVQQIKQKCMVDILPSLVKEKVHSLI